MGQSHAADQVEMSGCDDVQGIRREIIETEGRMGNRCAVNLA